MQKIESGKRELAQQGPRAMFMGYVAALAVCLIGNLAVRVAERAGWLSQPLRITLAVASVIPLIVTAVLFWRMLTAGLDEMQQRIVLEGMSLALALYVPVAALYVNLRTAGAWTPRLDPPDILLAPAALVAIGIALAWSRYR